MDEYGRETIRCRTIDDFVAYDLARNNKFICIEEHDTGDTDMRVSGIVKPIWEEDDDEEYDDDDNEKEKGDYDRVQLSFIFCYQIEYTEDEQR